MLGVLDCEEVEAGSGQHSRWYYQVSERIDPTVIHVPDLLPTQVLGLERVVTTAHISGT
jgi:hypothetical protein